MQQRYYDPVIGRFYSNDPVGFAPSNPMMFNRYAYANNNPYKFVDPDGMFSVMGIPQNTHQMGMVQNQTVALEANTQYGNLGIAINSQKVVPKDVTGVSLGVAGTVIGAIGMETGVFTVPSMLLLASSLDGIRNSWTGDTTLLGKAFQGAAASIGENVEKAGVYGDLANSFLGGGMGYAKFITGQGKIGDAVSTVSVVRDTELANKNLNKNSQRLTGVVRTSGRIQSKKIEQGQ